MAKTKAPKRGNAPDRRAPLQSEGAALYLGISRTYLMRLATSGEIPSVKTNWIRLFLPDDLDRWLDANRTPAKAKKARH